MGLAGCGSHTAMLDLGSGGLLTFQKFTFLKQVFKHGEQPIILQNGLLYPREEVEQRTHSGDEIETI